MKTSPMIRPVRERVYVSVSAIIDRTGYIQPKDIIWDDGRCFPIEAITDFHPFPERGAARQGDCYVVHIRGEKRRLYHEMTMPGQDSCSGRWYVERAAEA